MSDDKVMTLKERFDDHVAMAEKDAESARVASVRRTGDEQFFLGRAQLNATLALAVAQRMTAENTDRR